MNENKRYEIKFGNGVNGRQVQSGDQVYIYYLSTDGAAGEISENDAYRKSMSLYQSVQFELLKQSNNIKGDGVVYLVQSEADQVLVSNPEPSSKYYEGETVEDIRKNSPQTFSSQYRLVSLADFENYIRTNFSNFISDVRAVNNDTYLDTHIKYYYDLGLKSPSLESRVLYNQVQFSSSCNFNNVYMYCVPRLEKTTTVTKRNNYLTSAQKEIMIDRISQIKTVTSEPIIMDPVYVGVTVGLKGQDEAINIESLNNTQILIVQDDNSRANSNDIIQKVITIFKNYFTGSNAKIGMVIDLTTISNNILTIQGVSTFYTYRPDLSNTYIEGLSLVIRNPVYETDIKQTTQNFALPLFKFPFFENIDSLGSNIIVARTSEVTNILASGSSVTTTVEQSSLAAPGSDTITSNSSY